MKCLRLRASHHFTAQKVFVCDCDIAIPYNIANHPAEINLGQEYWHLRCVHAPSASDGLATTDRVCLDCSIMHDQPHSSPGGCIGHLDIFYAICKRCKQLALVNYFESLPAQVPFDICQKCLIHGTPMGNRESTEGGRLHDR